MNKKIKMNTVFRIICCKVFYLRWKSLNLSPVQNSVENVENYLKSRVFYTIRRYFCKVNNFTALFLCKTVYPVNE